MDDLAAMVSRGFKEVHEEFALVRKELRFEMNTGFAQVKEEFAAVRRESAEFRIEVKEEFADLRGDIDDLRKTVMLDHARRLRKIEHKLQIA